MSVYYTTVVCAIVASAVECVRECGLSEKDGRAGSCVGEQSAVYKMAADGPKR